MRSWSDDTVDLVVLVVAIVFWSQFHFYWATASWSRTTWPRRQTESMPSPYCIRPVCRRGHRSHTLRALAWRRPDLERATTIVVVTIEVRPATEFEDVCTMVGPKRPDATVCWCLTYRLSSKENRSLSGPARGERMRRIVGQGPPGMLAYDGGEVVGWAAVAPRSETSFSRSRVIPHVDGLDVWSVFCIRVRPGHRKTGIAHHLLQGAVHFAEENGAPAIEGYPLDNQGQRIDTTMAYVGTVGLFEAAGFVKASATQSVLDGFPRVIMRKPLDQH